MGILPLVSDEVAAHPETSVERTMVLCVIMCADACVCVCTACAPPSLRVCVAALLLLLLLQHLTGVYACVCVRCYCLHKY